MKEVVAGLRVKHEFCPHALTLGDAYVAHAATLTTVQMDLLLDGFDPTRRGEAATQDASTPAVVLWRFAAAQPAMRISALIVH